MDIWGDPWADNAKPELPSPKKNQSAEREEVTDVEPVRHATSVFPNGFEDEAGWGDFEKSTGSDSYEVDRGRNEELQWVDRQGHEEGTKKELTAAPYAEHSTGPEIPSPGWGNFQSDPVVPPHLPEGNQKGSTYAIPPSPIWESSCSSISSPTSAPGSPVNDATKIIRTTPAEKPTSELSTRPSTSSTSKTAISVDDASPETPRSPNMHGAQPWARESSHSDASGTENSDSPYSLRASFDGDYTSSKRLEEPGVHMTKAEELSAPEVGRLQSAVQLEEQRSPAPFGKEIVDAEDKAHVSVKIATGPRFDTNMERAKDIFKIRTPGKSLEEPKDELIDSTSTRKAWYRLTRPQTLQEFNMGGTDDSYVRVSWPKSHVRSETLNIVTKWASQDRINGRVVLGGKTGAAAFGWDMPSDGSAIPIRQESAMKQVPLGTESGKHFTAHERKPSMAHQLNPATSIPVAQFSWSTSATGISRPGSGIIASLGDVLDPNTFATTAGNQPGTVKQQRDSGLSSQAMKSPKTSSAVENPRPDTQPRGELSIGQPELSKLDTTESTLGKALEDDDEWGEMVKSPSAPPSPAMLPSPLPDYASAIKPSVDINEHIPILSSRRRPTPIMAPPSTKNIPEAMLSPARKAAFEAARATRFLNSQQIRTESIPNESSVTLSNTLETRRLSPSPWPQLTGSLDFRNPSPPGSAKPLIETYAPPASNASLESDLSFFDTPAQEKVGPSTKRLTTPGELTPEEEERVQRIMRNIPNLSFMLR
jgi:hypothetical protein